MIKGMHQWQAMSTVLCVWSQGVGAVPDIRGAIHLCTQANGQHMGLAQVRGGTERAGLLLWLSRSSLALS